MDVTNTEEPAAHFLGGMAIQSFRQKRITELTWKAI